MDGNKVVNASNLAELAKKIKEGGGSEQHLYWHSVEFTANTSDSNTLRAGVIILNDSPTLFTTDTLFDMLTSSGARFFAIYGEINASGTFLPIHYFTPSGGMVGVINTSNMKFFYKSGITSIYDAVNQIF